MKLKSLQFLSRESVRVNLLQRIGKTKLDRSSFISLLTLLSGLSLPNAASAVTITYENPNIYSASSSIGTTKQVDFESATLGTTNNYNINFVDNTSRHDYIAKYDRLRVQNYGGNGKTAGAGYTGKFAVNDSNLRTTNLNLLTKRRSSTYQSNFI